jgi:hypothetical protein
MRKNKRPELSQVVEDIYEPALDSARWKDTIATIARYVGGQAGGLALKDCQSKNLNVFYDVGFDPECIEVYLATYSRFDPLATAPLFDVRRVANVPDLMPYDEYLNGRFYREWAQPHGWLDSANAIIERSGTSSTLLRIVTRKNTGLVDDKPRRQRRHRWSIRQHRGRPQARGCGSEHLDLDPAIRQRRGRHCSQRHRGRLQAQDCGGEYPDLDPALGI